MMTPLDISNSSARAFRRAAIRFLCDDLGERGYTDAYMEKMLTDDEYRRYRAMLEKEEEVERNRLSPEEELQGNALLYWDRARRLADSMWRIRRNTKNRLTGQSDYSLHQKKRITEIVGEAQELLEFFEAELTEAEKHNFRDMHTSDPRYATFQRLECELPCVKSKAETSPYGRLWVYVQHNFLLELLDELTPDDERETTPSDVTNRQRIDWVRRLKGRGQ